MLHNGSLGALPLSVGLSSALGWLVPSWHFFCRDGHAFTPCFRLTLEDIRIFANTLKTIF